jgi:antitoxin VapB
MKTASLFMNGRSQAVRLPAEFRFASKQVFIFRDKRTGNVVLSDKPPLTPWQEFMDLRATLGPVPEDFLQTRQPESTRGSSSETRNPFEGWKE